VYTTALAVTSNDPDEPQVDVTVILTVSTPVYAVDVTAPNAALSGYVGEVVTYSVTVQNMGNVDDSFGVDLAPDQWSVSSAGESIGPLASNATGTMEIYVTVPTTATDGAMDTVGVTFTSVNDPSASDAVILATTAKWHKLYLPFLLKGF
jgi:uncharacterized membrane protein